MAERTNKLAEAIAKDNDIALGEIKDNIETVVTAEVSGEENMKAQPVNVISGFNNLAGVGSVRNMGTPGVASATLTSGGISSVSSGGASSGGTSS